MTEFRASSLKSSSPIQAAGIKTCRFSLFSKAFSEFESQVFKILVWGSFYELVYAKVFVFQCLEWVRISLGLWDTFLSSIRFEIGLKEKLLTLTTVYFYSKDQAQGLRYVDWACQSPLPYSPAGTCLSSDPYRLGLKMTNKNWEKPLRARLKMVLCVFSNLI